MSDSGRSGMTLVELMISLVVFGVILGVVFGFLTESRRSYQSTRERAQFQQGLRAVMSLVTREVRSTGCDPTGVGFERFATADANQFRCRMDLNGDTDVTDTSPDEDIAYVFDAATGELSRTTAGNAAVVVLRGLRNCRFGYFDADGIPLPNVPLNATDRAAIAAIDLVMAGETDQHEPVSYSTRIAVRNN
jgi:prepilin-type N-terminal cleavage/methylation domain-containing protein